MAKRVSVLNSPIDVLTMSQTISLVKDTIQEKKKMQHVVVNAGKLVAIQKDRDLYKSVVESDVINADGQAVVWASRILNQPLPERVTGFDLMVELIELSPKTNFTCFFFGAKEEIVSEVASIYEKKFGKAIIAGYRNGYYADDEEYEIAKHIADCKPDMLFIAITSPKKENFMNKYKDVMNIPFVMGVGGSFDVIAGKTKRAPLWMQNVGLEWFFRFIQEPRRMWRRYIIGNAEFIWLVAKQKFGLYVNPWNK